MHPKSAQRLVILCIIICSVCLIFSIVPSLSITNTPKFDENKAFAILKKQCDFGPRPVGTESHERTKGYLVQEMKQYADSVTLQEFNCILHGKQEKLTNIIGRFGDAGKPAILLCAHWDTRPIADMEKDPSKREQPIIGANDGASGVAVLLELARIFKQIPPPIPIMMVLFDGEDYGPSADDMFLGSTHFAANLERDTSLKYGILLDMIGDANLGIYREGYSENGARNVNDIVWGTAKKLGYQRYFLDRVKYTINDDHVPLLKAGVKCIDLIDFDYPYWHTTSDTADKCSPNSLKIVGNLLKELIYSQQKS